MSWRRTTDNLVHLSLRLRCTKNVCAKSVFIFVFVCWLVVPFFRFYVSSKDDNKGLGFGRDIVTCYQNLSYSLNKSAVDRGNSRRPVVTCRKEVPWGCRPVPGRPVTYPDQSPTTCKTFATYAIVMSFDRGECLRSQSGCSAGMIDTLLK